MLRILLLGSCAIQLLLVSAPSVVANDLSPWCDAGGKQPQTRVLFVLGLDNLDRAAQVRVDEILESAGQLQGVECGVVEDVGAGGDDQSLTLRSCGAPGRVNLDGFSLEKVGAVLSSAQNTDGALTVIVVSNRSLERRRTSKTVVGVGAMLWFQINGPAPDVPGLVALQEGTPVEKLAPLLDGFRSLALRLDVRGTGKTLTPVTPLEKKLDVTFESPIAMAFQMHYEVESQSLPPEVGPGDVCRAFPPSVTVAEGSYSACEVQEGRLYLLPGYNVEERSWKGVCSLNWQVGFAPSCSFPRPAHASQRFLEGTVNLHGPFQFEAPLAFVVEAVDGVGELVIDGDAEEPQCVQTEKGNRCTIEWRMPEGTLVGLQDGGGELRIFDDGFPEGQTLDAFWPTLPTPPLGWRTKDGVVGFDLELGEPEPGEAWLEAGLVAHNGWLTSTRFEAIAQIPSYAWVWWLLSVSLVVGIVWLVLVLRAPPKLKGLEISVGDNAVVVFTKNSRGKVARIALGRLIPEGQGQILVERRGGNKILVTPIGGAVLRKPDGKAINAAIEVAQVVPGGRRIRLLQKVLLENNESLKFSVRRESKS